MQPQRTSPINTVNGSSRPSYTYNYNYSQSSTNSAHNNNKASTITSQRQQLSPHNYQQGHQFVTSTNNYQTQMTETGKDKFIIINNNNNNEDNHSIKSNHNKSNQYCYYGNELSRSRQSRENARESNDGGARMYGTQGDTIQVEVMRNNHRYYNDNNSSNNKKTIKDNRYDNNINARLNNNDQHQQQHQQYSPQHQRQQQHEQQQMGFGYATSQQINKSQTQSKSKYSQNSGSLWIAQNNNYNDQQNQLDQQFKFSQGGSYQNSSNKNYYANTKKSTDNNNSNSRWYSNTQQGFNKVERKTKLQKQNYENSSVCSNEKLQLPDYHLKQTQFLKVQSQQQFYPSTKYSNQTSQKHIIFQNQIQQLKSNSIVSKKCHQYISWLYEVFSNFQKNSNVQVLREINKNNKQRMLTLFQELQLNKENQSNNLISNNHENQESACSVKMKTSFTQSNENKKLNKTQNKKKEKQNLLMSLRNIQTQKNQLLQQINREMSTQAMLQQQISSQRQIYTGKNLDASRVRQQNHLVQMQQSVKQLDDEIRQMSRKNQQISKKLVALPFFKEWNIMYEQAKGARKIALKLKHQIQKRQSIIKQHNEQSEENKTVSSNNNSRSSSTSKKNLQEGLQAQQNSRVIPSFKKPTQHHAQKVPYYAQQQLSQSPPFKIARSNSRDNITRKSDNSFPIVSNNQQQYSSFHKPQQNSNHNNNNNSRFPSNHFPEHQQKQSPKPFNDVVIRHLSHSSRMSQSKKSSNVNTVKNSVDKYKQRNQSYDKKKNTIGISSNSGSGSNWNQIPVPKGYQQKMYLPIPKY